MPSRLEVPVVITCLLPVLCDYLADGPVSGIPASIRYVPNTDRRTLQCPCTAYVLATNEACIGVCIQFAAVGLQLSESVHMHV